MSERHDKMAILEAKEKRLRRRLHNLMEEVQRLGEHPYEADRVREELTDVREELVALREAGE